MDAAFYDAAAKLVDAHVVDQARQVEKTNRRPVQELVDQRRLPTKGWSDEAVEKLLRDCAAMDSNNFEENVGVGEREARVLSGVVRRRHFGLAHGVGRSGDVAAVQPKAAGSSLLAKLANALALDALKEAGLVEFRRAVVLPCATGLSLSLCLLALRNQLPPTERAKKSKALWCRVDQKSCFKGILLAGLEAEVVAPRTDGSAPIHNRKTQPPSSNDELRTNLEDLERRLQNNEDVFCVVTTTSCFAPRAPDDVVGVARLCLKHNVRNVVNNAYGVQCSKTCAQIARASRVGRVDVVVASTDKNFLVPVGGAVVAGNNEDVIDSVGRAYPGRASATPCVDLLATLLGLGRNGWRSLLDEREAQLEGFRSSLEDVARKHGERILDTPHNRISFGVTLSALAAKARRVKDDDGAVRDRCTKFGSMLFTRCVSGTRVVARETEAKDIAGYSFIGWGASCDDYPEPYFTAACALGASQQELADFVGRLDRAFGQAHKQLDKELRRRSDSQDSLSTNL
jgi:O-phospho-L-seryl-tRNASec:L-selenocysteinyl-tRNA synthase